MDGGFRAAAIAALVAAASFAIQADTPSQSAAIQLQIGEEFFAEGRYQDALDAYQIALTAAGPDEMRSARSGIIKSALRVAEFDLARAESEKLVTTSPKAPEALALHADALWASGLFE